MDLKLLVQKAIAVSKNCPNSDFKVGAALVTTDDKIYTGCNVKNHGLQSICAERTAFVKALSEGERNFKCIMIVGKADTDEFYTETMACGYCRQFMSEFCEPDFLVYSYDEKTDIIKHYTLAELLPHNFKT